MYIVHFAHICAYGVETVNKNTETYIIVKVKIITLKNPIYHVARSVCQVYILLSFFFFEHFKEVFIL